MLFASLRSIAGVMVRSWSRIHSCAFSLSALSTIAHPVSSADMN